MGACRARTGGALTKCVFAFVHTAVHLLVALMLMVLLELGVETCIRSAPPHCSSALPVQFVPGLLACSHDDSVIGSGVCICSAWGKYLLLGQLCQAVQTLPGAPMWPQAVCTLPGAVGLCVSIPSKWAL